MATGESTLRRVPSGVPGLDEVLRGGFIVGSTYIVQGTPGAGKTVLGNQICFNRAAAGEKALYVTLLAETHARMMANLQSMSFFDRTVIPDRLRYVSAFRTLEEGGLKGLVDLLRQETRAFGASILILDGLVAAEESSASQREFKKFIHEIQVQCSFTNATAFLLTSGRPGGEVRPEQTMVDGLLELFDEIHGERSERVLVVKKFRGSGYLRGRHHFEVTDRGIVLFPRLEAEYRLPSPQDPCRTRRMTSGSKSLDKILGGGFPCDSTTVVLGATGSGKTTIGLQFLSALEKKETGLLFGFYETPPRVLLKSKLLDLGLEELVREGRLEMIWQTPTEHSLDELGHRLIESVRRRKPARVFVDGLSALKEMADAPNRMSRFFTALTHALRTAGATTLYTYEVPKVLAAEFESPHTGLSAVAENILLLRFEEVDSDIRRTLSVIKVRDGEGARGEEEFAIGRGGITIGKSWSRGRRRR